MLGFIKVQEDKNKAEAILETVDLTMQRICETTNPKYSSLVVKDYYESIRELMGALLLLDGYSLHGESSHKLLIDYLFNKGIFDATETQFVHEIRVLRHKVFYDGYAIDHAYLERNRKHIEKIISVLRRELQEKI
jgi:hypothetical protein